MQKYHVLFGDGEAKMYHKGKLIATGYLNRQTFLYYIPITNELPRVADRNVAPRVNPLETELAANAYEIRVAPPLIAYLHAAAGYPPKSSFIRAINAGFYATWPGLTAARVRKHLPGKVDETAMGHLNMVRQHIRSTKEP